MSIATATATRRASPSRCPYSTVRRSKRVVTGHRKVTTASPAPPHHGSLPILESGWPSLTGGEVKRAHKKKGLVLRGNPKLPTTFPLRRQPGAHENLSRSNTSNDQTREPATPRRFVLLMARIAIPNGFLDSKGAVEADRGLWIPRGHAVRHRAGR